MTELSTTDAREGFADLVGRVAYGKERVVITRNGKRQAAVIPVEDLERLQALDRDRAMAAVRELQADSVRNGTDKLTVEEIDAEIRAARAERRAKKSR
jgi:prevent-host-death family protein